ncbi:site-2 protease family protein [Gracilimonas mengyeensis]|uniref:Peptidase family M50 n=1 Tax=Gracilimonas mengyeensis TaxID=1302730 RepID=A0A521BUN6_9BACT|nr:site-2 protease family protein [Gracilimonas mengyeensis]SMO50892.1 Peptidase family M50 [Gracilimonas mengyeensis]
MSTDTHQEEITTDFEVLDSHEEPTNKLDTRTILKHLGLFLLTFFCVTMAGANYVGFAPSGFPFALPSWPDTLRGLLFAVLFLCFLTVHEFGHYLAAVKHNIKTTLPYYIPIPFAIGTMGAVIRIKERIRRMYQLFDVGAAGPVGGFIVALVVLLIGFATLPEPDYVMNFAGHEELKEYVAQNGTYPEHITDRTEMGVLTFGNTLLYSGIASFFDNVPPMWEMYHYPFLLAGWLGLFFTALNLMPVGQLDGGHILYSLIGYRKHSMVAKIFFAGITGLAGTSAVPFLGDFISGYINLPYVEWLVWGGALYLLMRKAFRTNDGWVNAMVVTSLAFTAGYTAFFADAATSQNSLVWLFWCFFIAFVVKVEHPPVDYEEKLSPTRRVIGWLSMLIFILCISPNPIYIN